MYTTIIYYLYLCILYSLHFIELILRTPYFADDNSTIYTNIGIDCANIANPAGDTGVQVRCGRHRDAGKQTTT